MKTLCVVAFVVLQKGHLRKAYWHSWILHRELCVEVAIADLPLGGQTNIWECKLAVTHDVMEDRGYAEVLLHK